MEMERHRDVLENGSINGWIFRVGRLHADQFRLAGATFDNIWGLLHFAMFVFRSSLSHSVRRRLVFLHIRDVKDEKNPVL